MSLLLPSFNGHEICSYGHFFQHPEIIQYLLAMHMSHLVNCRPVVEIPGCEWPKIDFRRSILLCSKP